MAFNLAAEAGEFSRFKSAGVFAAWLGLVPSKRQSAEKDARRPITKAGNKHVRRLLVELTWHYCNVSEHAKELAPGQTVDKAVRRHALKGQRRLITRRRALEERGMYSCRAN